jgi:alpha-mannosidase
MDTQWRWTIQDTIQNDLVRTVEENAALFLQYPDYRFSFEGAWRYMLIKEYHPIQFAALKEWTAKGNWYPAGAFVESVDANIPSPESLIRQALYGNRFFEREFGKRSHDVILADSFGFGFALPSIATHCGLLGFSSYKLSWGSALPVPFDIGLWAGPDGSRIAAALNPGSFATRITSDLSADENWMKRGAAIEEKSGLPAGYRYFGVGDRGGAPDEASVDWLMKAIETPSGPLKVRSATSEQLFLELTAEQRKRLPVYQGEFLMTTHGVGCYTSHAEMKRWNRQNEQLADSAERAALIADWLGGAPYPGERLRENWIRFLWNQMHDIITGTCIPRAYMFSWNDELLAQNQFKAVLKDSVEAVSRGLDTQGDGIPLIVFNPIARHREEVISVEVEFPGTPPQSVKVQGPNGKSTEAQIAEGIDLKRTRVTFVAEAPSVGFSVYHLQSAKEREGEIAGEMTVDSNSLENERYRVSLDKQGDIAKIFDKQLQRELLAGPLRLELRPDVSERYPAWEIPYQSMLFGPRDIVHGPAQIRIIEQGPHRVALEVTRSYGKSKFVQQIRLAAGKSSDRIELETHIDWKERGTLLKLVFPLASSNSKATYDLGLGTIERGNNTPKLYEVPAQQWADLTGPDGSWGVSIITDSKIGWDKPDDRTLRSTLIHTPSTSKFYKDQSWLDIGRHKMKHVIFGHAGDWRKGGTANVAAEINQPMIVFQAPRHKGILSKSFSLMSVNRSEVSVRALKKAEDGEEVVVRLQEMSGASASGVELSFASRVTKAREVNGCETPLDTASVKDGKLLVDMTAYQPRTFALTLERPTRRAEPPKSSPISMRYDAKATSEKGKPAKNAFDPNGVSIPDHLYPKEIKVDGIRFFLGDSKTENALRCKGQTVTFPKAAQLRRLHFLAAAAEHDTAGRFVIGGTNYDLVVRHLGTKIGQNDVLPVNIDGRVTGEFESGFVHKEEVAWTATHRHDSAGVIEPYLFCHLFKYSMAVPAGVTSVKLPDNELIGVFAISLTTADNEEVAFASSCGEDMRFWTDAPPKAEGAVGTKEAAPKP